MAKPYSMDLRDRVVQAVERDGLSCNQASARYEVAVSTAIDWSTGFVRRAARRPARWAVTDRRSLLESIGSGLCSAAESATSRCAGWSPSWLSGASASTIAWSGHSSTRRSSVTKKDADCQRAGPSRRSASAPAMDGLPGSHRSDPPGLHRRDLDQDQHGAVAWLEPSRPAPAGQGAAWSLDDHDLPCRPAA